MKILLTSLFVLAALVSSGQTTLGLGLVSIHFEKTVVHFYSDTVNKEETKTIKLLQSLEFGALSTVQVSNSSGSIMSLNEQGEWEEAQWLKPEQSGTSLVLRCKRQTNGWYEVIVNNQTNQTYWIRKSKLINYLSWEDYLKSKREISRLPTSKQKIKRLPTEQSKGIRYSGRECFRIRSVNGDWVEVLLIDYIKDDENKSKHKMKSGWIKWRDGDTLLINYYCPSKYINGVKYING